MKRSAHVALLLMGATGIGAAGYAMMPRADCDPQGNPQAAQGPVVSSAQSDPCRSSSSSSSGHGGSSSRSAFLGSRSTDSSSHTAAPSGTVSASRGGFGSTGGSIGSGS